ncbi:X2-like carbohydrate binding domain-containing protein [Ruminococcus sp.]
MTGVMRRFSAALAAAAMAVSIVPFADISAYAEYAAAHPEGFVYADGSKFMCDGSPYYYGGTNCYYLTYKSKSEVKNVFDDASKMGLKVIRIWGNLDVGKKTGKIDSQSGHEVFEGNNDGTGEKDGVYFQYWDDKAGKPVVNEGEDGLRRLDYVIKQAEEHDMKLVITFTNYWEAFGGMGQYVKWYQMSQGKSVGNSKVDEKDTCDFYTNETIKGWYKDYIKTLLNHTNYYTGEKLMDSEAVFSWELSNEPRCTVDEFCKDDILYNWAKEMSAYVKSIDPYHMVSVGDEGFYNLGYQEAAKQDLPSAAYSGYYGVDFNKLMTIDTVDFGTPHMYVDQWGFDLGDDDLEWIKRHAQTTASADKPVIFEEFGLTDKTKRDTAYSDWLDIVTGDYYEGVEYQGFNYWMIASYLDDGTLYQDYDGYTVYGPEGVDKTDSTRTLMMNATAKMEKKNIVNTTDKSTYSFDRSNSGDVVVNVSMKDGSISGVEVGGKKLSSGDYTISGNTVTIKASYLKKQELAKYSCRILTTGGNQPKFNLTVSDSSIPKPVISPEIISVDVNPKKCSDVDITMDRKTSEFRGIIADGKTLAEGTDYTVSGDTVTLKSAYLKTLSAGIVTLTFDFYEGEDRELTINVSDTTGLDELDTFESYSDDKALWSAYSRNTGGNEVSLSLTTKNSSKALAFGYDIGSPNGYCGVNHPIAVRNASSFAGVELWIEGDGTGNSLTVQLRDANDNYFEAQIALDFTGGKTIKIPFADFKAPSWQSGGTLDTSKLDQFSFYMGGDSVTTGIVYIDDVVFYEDGQTEKPHLSTKSGTFDANAPSGVRTDLVLYGKSVESITANGKKLAGGSDYSTNGSQIMLNESWLKTLANGTYTLTYTFSDGSTDTFALTVKNVKSSHTHSYTAKVTKEATCTTEGERIYTCTCGDRYTETIPATGHSESAWIIDKAATAIGNGSKHTECTTCGKVIKTEVIPATGEVSDRKETVIFTGSAKTSGWGQAITLSTTKEGGSFDSSIIEKDGYFEVQFKGDTDKAEVILQSWSGGTDWARVSPTEVTEKDGIVYAKYSYDDVAAAFGTTDFSKVDRFHVGAANGDIEVLSVKYVVGKSTEPVDPVDPVDPDEPEQDPYVSIFWGAKSCGSWGQAVSVMTSKNYGSLDVSYLSANGYFYVEYSGAENEFELILQSWSGGASWARVRPSETGKANGHYYAKFTYADCVKALGAGFDKLDQLHAAAKNGDITVYSICYCTPAR